MAKTDATCGPSSASVRSGSVPVERSSLRVLRELRWGHVVVELALLVVGILVALAVDGWIDGRREARVERQYLELLVRDLERDLEMLADVVAFENAQIDASVRAYRAVRWAWRRRIVRPWPRRSDNSRRAARAAVTDVHRPAEHGQPATDPQRPARSDREPVRVQRSRAQPLIRDHKQEFVDRMYMTYFVDRGLVAPRPTRDLPGIAASDQRFAERAAVPISARDDRLWACHRTIRNGTCWPVVSGTAAR